MWPKNTGHTLTPDPLRTRKDLVYGQSQSSLLLFPTCCLSCLLVSSILKPSNIHFYPGLRWPTDTLWLSINRWTSDSDSYCIKGFCSRILPRILWNWYWGILNTLLLNYYQIHCCCKWTIEWNRKAKVTLKIQYAGWVKLNSTSDRQAVTQLSQCKATETERGILKNGSHQMKGSREAILDRFQYLRDDIRIWSTSSRYSSLIHTDENQGLAWSCASAVKAIEIRNSCLSNLCSSAVQLGACWAEVVRTWQFWSTLKPALKWHSRSQWLNTWFALENLDCSYELISYPARLILRSDRLTERDNMGKRTDLPGHWPSIKRDHAIQYGLTYWPDVSTQVANLNKNKRVSPHMVIKFAPLQKHATIAAVVHSMQIAI